MPPRNLVFVGLAALLFAVSACSSSPSAANGDADGGPEASSGSASDATPDVGSGAASDASAPTVTLSVDPVMVAAGQPATLTWSSTDATGCTASNSWSGSRSPSGTAPVTSPTKPGYYTYTLTCTGDGSTVTQSVILTAYGAVAPETGTDPEAGVSVVTWYLSGLYVPPPNHIVSLTTHTVVAPIDDTSTAANQDWNYWPGIQPAVANYGTLNNGVLQPTLNFYRPFTGWTAVSIYDNDSTSMGTADVEIVEGYQTSYFDEIDGNDSFDSNHAFAPSPGDAMAMSMTLDPSSQNWTVVNDDTTSSRSNTLIVNLGGQQQNYVNFALEVHYDMPVAYSPVFTDTVITFASPDTAGACSDALGPANRYTMTPPQLDDTKTVCTIAQVTVPHP